jgi:hypothetical protein
VTRFLAAVGCLSLALLAGAGWVAYEWAKAFETARQ